MQRIKKLREDLGLSQEQMAIYLDVSRSALGMAEKGRRRLPTAALQKLAELQKAVHNNIPHEPKALQQQAAKDWAAVKRHAKQRMLRAYQLQQELTILQEQHGRCMRLWQALGHLKQAAPATHPRKKEQLWLEVLEADTLKKMAACSLGQQALLQTWYYWARCAFSPLAGKR
jgi:transcriptional regulator with XRE-family HTH domain